MKFLLRWLTHLVAGVLVAAVCVAVMTMVIDHTLFSSHYIEQQAVQTNTYPHLSVALTNELLQYGNFSSPQAKMILQENLTPTVLQTKISSALNQLEAYYKGNGQVPTIDLTDIAANIRAAGLPLPANSTIDKPITFGSNTQAKGISKKFEDVKFVSLLVTVILVVTLLVLSWEQHRWSTLPDVAMVCGLLLGLIATSLALVPHIINPYIRLNFASNAFTDIAHDLIFSISRNLAQQIGIIAGVLFIVGLITRIILAKVKPAQPKTVSQRLAT
jgi:hypothetical protein